MSELGLIWAKKGTGVTPGVMQGSAQGRTEFV